MSSSNFNYSRDPGGEGVSENQASIKYTEYDIHISHETNLTRFVNSTLHLFQTAIFVYFFVCSVNINSLKQLSCAHTTTLSIYLFMAALNLQQEKLRMPYLLRKFNENPETNLKFTKYKYTTFSWHWVYVSKTGKLLQMYIYYKYAIPVLFGWPNFYRNFKNVQKIWKKALNTHH